MKRFVGVMIGSGLIAIILYLLFGVHSRDFLEINTNQVINHIEELSSFKYGGRRVGTKGNEAALEYIENAFNSYGLKTLPDIEGSVNQGYRQSFHVITPDIDLAPEFIVYGSNNQIGLSLSMFEDYNALPYFMGGDVDFEGPILMVGSNLLRIEPELIDGSVVVVDAGHLDSDWVRFVSDNGGKGLLICTDKAGYGLARRYERTKSLSTSGKTGDSILMGYLSREAYNDFEELLGDEIDGKKGRPLGVIDRARIRIKMNFPVVETSNVIGVIEGKKDSGQILILSADMDNVGMASESEHFPGVISRTSGIAGLLEIARILGREPGGQDETILFVAFNGQETDTEGVRYFISQLGFDSDRTRHIHIGPIGEDSYDPVSLLYNPSLSSILSQQMTMYGEDKGVEVVSLPSLNGSISMFSNLSIPSVILSSGQVVNNMDDNLGRLSPEKLESSLLLLMNFIKHEVYGDNYIDFMTGFEKVLICLLLVFAFLNLMLTYAIKRNPNKRIFGFSMEEISLSGPFLILKAFYKYLIPYGLAVLVLAIIANIDPNTNVVIRGNRMTTNFSWYLTLKDAIYYLESLLSPSTYTQDTVGNIMEVIQSAGSKSIKLVAASLGLAFTLGIGRGIYEAYRNKGKELRSLGSLIVFSIPDVLVVTLGMLLHTLFARKFPEYNEFLQPGKFILPLVTLSVIPTIYISRITYITIHEELTKDYIRHAKALGYSKFRIYMTEMMPAVIYKILDSIPAIMTMIFSNMIIVEYLFNYNGVVYYLLYLYNRHDVQRFVPLAVSLGMIYIGFTWIIRYIRFLLNPMKGELRP